MITISETPFKKTDYYRGAICIAVSGSDRIDWAFTLLRHVNGQIEYDVLVEDATPAQYTIIRATILANLNQLKVTFKHI